MVKFVSVLSPQPWDNDGKVYIANVTADFAFDAIWRVALQGNFQSVPRNIRWRFVLIDNISNSNPVTVRFGAQYSMKIPPASRQSYPIPDAIGYMQFEGIDEAVGLLFSEAMIAPDNQNMSVTINRSNLLFPIINRNVTASQTSDEGQKKIRFNPGADMIYSLLPAASLPNGFIQFVDNVSVGLNVFSNSGSTVSITPNGADTINDFFTAANPLILQPGDSGILINDGLNWSYQGIVSYIGLSPGFINVPNIPNLGRRPEGITYWLYCKTAEMGWNVGDTVLFGDFFFPWNPSGTFLPFPSITVAQQNNQLATLQFFSPTGFSDLTPWIVNRSTGAFAKPTLANWGTMLRCYVNW